MLDLPNPFTLHERRDGAIETPGDDGNYRAGLGSLRSNEMIRLAGASLAWVVVEDAQPGSGDATAPEILRSVEWVQAAPSAKRTCYHAFQLRRRPGQASAFTT